MAKECLNQSRRIVHSHWQPNPCFSPNIVSMQADVYFLPLRGRGGGGGGSLVFVIVY